MWSGGRLAVLVGRVQGLRLTVSGCRGSWVQGLRLFRAYLQSFGVQGLGLLRGSGLTFVSALMSLELRKFRVWGC